MADHPQCAGRHHPSEGEGERRGREGGHFSRLERVLSGHGSWKRQNEIERSTDRDMSSGIYCLCSSPSSELSALLG